MVIINIFEIGKNLNLLQTIINFVKRQIKKTARTSEHFNDRRKFYAR